MAPDHIEYGVAMGLTFDEFGMWLHRGGGYWQRASFDAIIVLLAVYVDNSTRTGAGTDSLSDAEVTARIKPFAQVDIRDANAPRVYKSGEEVYKAVCSACHASGAAGAPKFTNAADWAPRIAQGLNTLHNSALHGKGAMPPKGGSSAPDADVMAAVDYMVNAAK